MISSYHNILQRTVLTISKNDTLKSLLLRKHLKYPVVIRASNNRSICRQVNQDPDGPDRVFTIPNALTLGRMAATPVISYCVLHDAFPQALALFTVAGITDVLDGYIARNWPNQHSVFGSIIDPLADKILVTFLSFSLCAVDLLPMWLVGLVIFRDFCLFWGAMYIRYQTLPSNSLSRFFDTSLPTVQFQPLAISKFNTGVQLLMITSALSAPVFGFVDHPYLQYLCYFTAATTFTSGIAYIFCRNTFKLVKKTK